MRITVEGVADSGRVQTVYNFRVAEYHTYFVGSDEWGFSVWAHNACDIAGAKYAQTDYSMTFSMKGRALYSKLAGQKINTIEDLVSAIKAGRINPADVSVSVISRPTGTLILNTRTGQALEQAGVARSQWSIVDQTGNSTFERLLSMQLSRNNLTNRGIANPVWNGL